MKKNISLFICIVFTLSFSNIVFANAGPTYWEGYPSSEILSVDKNTNIKVENEDLIFDFSVNDNPETGELYYDGYTLSGRVAATYQMHNPTDDAQLVQMAFPFVGYTGNLARQNISITVDGIALPYEIYAGDVVGNRRGSVEEENKSVFDFDQIVSGITNEPYEAESFSGDETGTLYTITVSPDSGQRINYAIGFQHNPEKTKIISKNFNRFERSDNKIRLASWCDRPTIVEIYVLGEGINFNEEAFTDGQLTQKTDSYVAETTTQEVELKAYLLKLAEENPWSEYEDENENDRYNLSETQLYNIYAKALDRYFTQNAGFISENDLMSQKHQDRIFTLVYNVEFPPDSTKSVSVSYKSSGTMDMRETGKPMYTFDYILNPASNWSGFNNFNLKIITPQETPYIVKSSIELNKEESNIYTANLNSLPDEDLYFTLYENEKITLLDKATGKLHRSFGYMYPVVIMVITIIIGIVAAITILKRVIKKP